MRERGRRGKGLGKKIMALMLTAILLTGLIPTSVFANGSNVIITDNLEKTFEAESHGYDTFYYSDQESFSVGGESLTFTDGATASYGGNSLPINNKVLDYSVISENGSVKFTFNNIDTPIGSVSGAWNSGYQGKEAIVYTADVATATDELYNLAGEKLEGNLVSENLNSLTLTLPEGFTGTINLTNGYIYEMANAYSPGIDFGDGKGVVKDNTFGRLPNFTITIEASEPEEETVAVTGIKGDKLRYDLKVGDTETAAFSAEPENATNKNISYESFNPAVATIDAAGNITAVSKGRALARATTEDGSFQTFFDVYVTEKEEESKEVKVTGVTVEKEVYDFKVGDVEPINVFVAPEDATNKNVTYKSYNESVAEIDEEGNVKAIKEGSAMMGVITEDGAFSTYFMVYVTEADSSTDGIILVDENGEEFLVKDHKYDTYYYLEGEKITIGEEVVTFVDESTISYGEKTLELKNKKLDYEAEKVEDQIWITFNNLSKPVGSVAGAWNSGYGGDTKLIYTSDHTSDENTVGIDIEGNNLIGNIWSASGETAILKINISEVASDEINLTGGYIYEMANEWSPGIDFGDGRGTVRDNTFNRMPNLIVETTLEEVTKVTGISIDEASYSLKVGGSQQLNFTISPENATNKKIEYKSYNEEIAIVDENGKVTALKEGRATITATTEDGGFTKGIFVDVVSGGGDIAPAIVPDDFENDLLLNSDFEKLTTGETYTMFGRSIPQLVDNMIENTGLTIPEFTYEVVEGDSVSVAKIQGDFDQKAIVTAEKEGVSIIKVSYGPVKPDWSFETIGAISQVNEAYFVVEVNDNPADVEISSPELDGVNTFDTIYYAEGDTTPYSFSVNAEGADSVEVTNNGHGLLEENGKYTANLENRQNIIGVTATKDGKTNTQYYMVDARKIEITVTNKTDPGKPFEVGDTANVSFKGITLPIPKLAGLYNPQFGSGQWGGGASYVEYTANGQSYQGKCGQWDLATNNDFDVQITETGTMTFNEGHIQMNWWGEEAGAHKEKFNNDYAFGGATPEHLESFSTMPTFSIEVVESISVASVEFDEEEVTVYVGSSKTLGYEVLPANAPNKDVTFETDNEKVASVDENGKVVGVGAGTATITINSEDSGVTDTIKVTVEERNTEIAPAVVPDDFENDILLNADFITLGIGEDYTMFSRRISELVESMIDNNNLVVPNFNYEVISGTSVTLKEVANDPDQKAVVTGESEGISIIKVTYDEVKPEWSLKTYGASSVVNTAYFVVDVNEDPADVNVASPELENITTFDTIYFTEGETTPFSFTVDGEGADSIEVTNNGNILTEKDGSYTADLENRQNIIQITATKEDKTKTMVYMVDARMIEINVENVTRPGAEPQKGDTIEISFKGVTLPVPKLAGLYNPQYGANSPSIEYTMDGEKYYGKGGQWDLATNNDFRITLDEAGSYDFTGGKIRMSWWGQDAGAHQEKFDNVYDFSGGMPEHTGYYYSTLPNFSIEVDDYQAVEPIEIKLSEDKIEMEEGTSKEIIATVVPDEATERGIVWESSDEDIATVSNGLINAKKPGTVTITAKSDKEHLGDIKATCEVTVIGELPATEKEKEELKGAIEEAKAIKENTTETDYGKVEEDWKELQEEIKDAEGVYENEDVLVAQVDKQTENLEKAMTEYNKSVKYMYTLSLKEVEEGVEVKINFPNLGEYSTSGITPELSLNYNTDLPNFENVTTGNKVDNQEELKTLTFVVPNEESIFTLSEGNVKYTYRIHPQFGYWTNTEYFGKGDFPEIVVEIGEVKKVTSVNIVQDQEKIIDNGTTNLTAEIEPANATNKEIIWTSSDSTVATVNKDGTVTGVGDGYVEITAEAKYGEGKDNIVIQVENIPARIENVKKAIDEIGSLTLDSEAAIEKARTGYDALTEEQKVEVDNIAILVAAESAFFQIKSTYDAIEAIKVVDLKTLSDITNARSWYDGLSSDNKAAVTNIEKLEKLEKEVGENKNDLDEAQKVVDVIEAIGEIDLENKMPIDQGRYDYDKLSEKGKSYVYNYETLTKAEAEWEGLYNESKAKFVEEKINGIGTVTEDKEDLIFQARVAYSILSEDQKKLVSNYVVLEAAEKALEDIKNGVEPETPTPVVPEDDGKGNDDTQATGNTPQATGQTITLGNSTSTEEISQAAEEIKDEALNFAKSISDKDTEKTKEQVNALYAQINKLSDIEREALENDAEFQSAMKQISGVLQSDTTLGASVENIDWYVKMTAEKVQLTDSQMSEIDSYLNGKGEVVEVLDISLENLLTGTEYKPGDMATVALEGKLLESLKGYNTIIAIHYDDEGKPSYIKCRIEDGKIVFDTKEFSTFAFVGYDGEWDDFISARIDEGQIPTSSSPFGSENNTLIYILIGVGAIMLLGSLVYMRKNKANENKASE